MGCGCLGKKKVEILSRISEANVKYDIPNIINLRQSNSNLSDGNQEGPNQNRRENNNNNINNNLNSNDNNINVSSPQNNNNSSNAKSISINIRSNHNNINNSSNNNSNNDNNNINNNALHNINNDISPSNNSNSNSNHNNNNNYINNLQNLLNNMPEENNLNLGPAYEPYLQSKHDENFNYKEIENEYIGIGVKRMRGYICPVTFEELQKIRDDFWSSRIEGNKSIWEVLHMICNDNTLSIDDIDIFMKSSNIVTYKGCINVTYDSKGFLYEIPNYCINDPVRYEKIEEDIKAMPKKENIEIKIRCLSEEDKVKTNNFETVENLKESITLCKNFKNKYKSDSIRLFFGGKELQNQKELCFFSKNMPQLKKNILNSKTNINVNNKIIKNENNKKEKNNLINNLKKDNYFDINNFKKGIPSTHRKVNINNNESKNKKNLFNNKNEIKENNNDN